MEIWGHGYIAELLRPLTGRHPHVLALAMGVAYPGMSQEGFSREQDIVLAAVIHSLATGKRLLFFSSVAVYGGIGSTGREADPRPDSAYGRHKITMEDIIRQSDVDHLIARIGYLCCPLAPSQRLIPSLIAQCEAGAVTVHRGASRDIVRTDHVISALDYLLSLPRAMSVYNVGSGHALEVGSIVDHLEVRLGLSVTRTILDRPSRHEMSIERLRADVPLVEDFGFGRSYALDVIDDYLLQTGRIAAPIAGVGSCITLSP